VKLAEQVKNGDRRALARAITLVESTRADDRDEADQLLEALLPSTGKATRVGISGTPGVGKSTFIEALGTMLCSRGERVAVLAVDPSSQKSGGSLLGDKTRMEKLANEPKAYVRPQPSSGALGGVAPSTREALLVCEAAGFSTVIVETVGVGQSEAAVADMVDTFVLLVSPAGGDELQGAKRGILELVDVIVVNKADGDLLVEAKKTRDDYDVSSKLFLRDAAWQVPVVLASAKEGSGVDDVWKKIQLHGRDEGRRVAQAERALWRTLESEVVRSLRANPDVQKAVDEVRAGKNPLRVARELAARFELQR
jgi:LAO/AO transport system kinase